MFGDTHAIRATSADTLRVRPSPVERLRPEAAYFGPHSGVRTAFAAIDLEDPSQLPGISEPFFAQLGARVEMFPVMTAQDVQAGLERYASS